MTTDHQRVPVNGARLRAARLSLGLGTRELSRASGTSFTVVDTAEKENALATSITVADARRLAGAAGLSLSDLLGEPGEQVGIEDSNGIKRLAAALTANTRMTPTDDLAVALGWTLPQLHRNARALDAALEPVGLRVHRISGQMCIRPRDANAHDVANEIDRRRAGRDTMTILEARLLRDALLGDSTDTPKDSEKPALGHLINLGVLRPGRRKEPFHVVTEAASAGFRSA